MKKLPPSLLGLIFTLFATTALAQVAPQEARNFQIRETHTESTSVDHLIPPLKARWTVNFGQNISSTLIADGRVFVTINNDTSQDTTLFALDARNGGQIWTTQLPGQVDFSSAATVSQGVIHLSDSGSGGTVYAVNATSGAVLSTAPVGKGDSSDSADKIFDSQIGSFKAKNTAAFSGNRGFFLDGPDGFGSPGTLRARDVNTNALLWSFSGDGFLRSAVLVVNDYVYLGSSLGKIYAVDAATGQQVWATTAGSIPYVDEQNVSQPLTSFAAGEGLLVVSTSTTLTTFEGDTTPPTLTFGAPSPAPNSAGWNKTPVDLSFTTADDLSGVQSSDPASPLRFTAEGANQTQQVTVTDNAGNTATFTSPAINIDLTPPSSTAVIPGASQDQEWFSGPVQVTLNATDNLSGVKPGSFFRLDGGGPNLIFGSFFISIAGLHTLQYASEDRAGNLEASKTRIINIDPAPPVTSSAVSGILGTNGWYRSAVQVSLTATDNLNAVVGSFYRIDGGVVQTYGGPFGLSTPGLHIIEYWSVDHVHIEATRTLVVRIDTDAPLVTATANPSTAPKGPKPVNVTISGSVTDAVSAVSSSFNVIDEYGTTQPSGPITLQANGNYSFTLALPANRPGNDRDGHLYTIVVQGVDQAGNSTTATTTFRVN
jgi:outer membrane protein assembly factor BamB